jgi:hypothetical protein
MPPRFAYWTILIDDGPTAFRAREAQELLPTLNQLKRTNQHVTMKWFSGGKLWDSPETARLARRRPQPIRHAKASDRRGAGRPAKRPSGPKRPRPGPTKAAAASPRRKRRDDDPSSRE